MPPLKIAIQLRSLRMPLRKALETAHQLGAAAVEIDARDEVRPGELSETGRRQLRKLLDDLNLRVAAIGFPTRRGYNVTEDLDRRVAATKEAMRLAHALGARFVINHVGRIPESSEAADWPILLDALADLGAFGNHVGAVLTAETGSEPGEDLARLLAALPQGTLGVTLNPGNLIVNGFAPLDAITALRQSIWHVHAKDGVRDLARGRGEEVPLGRGVADFPAILAALDEFGYRGYLGIERTRADDPVREIAQAVQYLNNIQ